MTSVMDRSGRPIPRAEDSRLSAALPTASAAHAGSLGHEDDHAVRLYSIAFLRQQGKFLVLFGNVLRRRQGSIGQTKPLPLSDLRQLKLQLSRIRVGNEMEVVAPAVLLQLGQLHSDCARSLAPIGPHPLYAVPGDVEACFSVQVKALPAQQETALTKSDHQLKEAKHAGIALRHAPINPTYF